MGRGEIKRMAAGEKGNESTQGTCFHSLPPVSYHFATEGAPAEERKL